MGNLFGGVSCGCHLRRPPKTCPLQRRIDRFSIYLGLERGTYLRLSRVASQLLLEPCVCRGDLLSAYSSAAQRPSPAPYAPERLNCSSGHGPSRTRKTSASPLLNLAPARKGKFTYLQRMRQVLRRQLLSLGDRRFSAGLLLHRKLYPMKDHRGVAFQGCLSLPTESD